MLKMLHGMVGGVNVTFPHGAATVTAAVFRQLHVPVTGWATVLTSSPGAAPMHPATSATQAPTSDLRTLLFILGLPSLASPLL
jgi:hypothetical protein